MAQTFFRNLPIIRSSKCLSHQVKFKPTYLRNANNVYTTAKLQAVAGTPIKMPSLSPTMTEGTIVKWLKQEGDVIAPGDVLCEIQTDKAVVSMDTEDEGILAKILVSEDTQDIKVGTLIALMVEEGEDYKDVEIPNTEDTQDTVVSDQAIKEEPPVEENSSLKIGPAAKHLLGMYGLNSSAIPASGPRHTLSKGDILSYIESNKVKPIDQSQFSSPSQPMPTDAAASAAQAQPSIVAAPATVENTQSSDVEVSNMRRTIAKRLTQSKTTIPHAYASITCTMNNILMLRKNLKDENIKVSVNDFIIKSAAMALKKVPEVNSQLGADGNIKQLLNIDVSIAVATDSGLITPIVKNASDIGVETISNVVKELAGRARIGKLLPEEFIGGSFSISNLGMFGITEFSAVINPPQAAILAIGTSELMPKEIDVNGCKKIRPENVMTSTLSYDSRIVTEEAAVRFLRIFQENMENPIRNLLDGPKSEATVASLL